MTMIQDRPAQSVGGRTSAEGPGSGKTALVTGATGGIGRVAARELAARGMRVIIVGRDPERTARVAADIGVAPADAVVADLSVGAEVRRVAARVRELTGRLDVLLNNAGAFYARRQETPEGIEATWALNHLAYFLLTRELDALLRATPGARVVNVSSAAHAAGRVSWDDPELRRGYGGWAAYAQSKLANVLFTRELAHRLRGSGVSANALHPGMVATGFGHNNGSGMSRVFGLLRPFSRTEEQGAQTSLYLAASPQVEGVSGGYFSDEREVKPSPQALDDAAAARLWRLSEEYVGE